MAPTLGTVTSTHMAAPDRYDRIPYRQVGASGLRLPAISLGLWQNFGDDRPIATQRAIVRHAFDRGITHFDLGNNLAAVDRLAFRADELAEIDRFAVDGGVNLWTESSAA